MRNAALPSVAGLLLSLPLSVTAATFYVDVNNLAPAFPYTNWVTAATNIQDAVDVAVAGDLIQVTNGVYQTGARAVYGMSNRVAVTKPVTVQSINGATVTSIVGYQVPGTTNGAAAVRCVYLTNGAVLAGFTLTNGATQISSDSLEDQSGGGVWCESGNAVVSNCVLAGNSADLAGGGAYSGTLNNCALTGNSTHYGGGAEEATLNNCTLAGNWADCGGGTENSTLNNCTLTGNWAIYGGGAYYATLNNSTLAANWADSGGGAYECTLHNCTLTGNWADYGGGAEVATLNNCTLTGNWAQRGGGGADWSMLNNCIVYYNSAPLDGNYSESTLNYCCTTPLPATGTGNLTAEPQLASVSHLSAGSPCREAGSADYATDSDVDGEPWANPPSMGCDEYWSGSVTGALSAVIVVAYTNVAVGFALDLRAVIAGRVSESRWHFGDGVVVSNRPYASHAWGAAGDYVVELRAYNDNYPGGVAATVTVHVMARPVHYVALSSPAPAPPYSSWATAATNIQDAVDAATVAGALVWVTNGVYKVGAREVYGMSNRVAVTKPVTVQSTNGPEVTFIVGYRVPGTTNGAAAVRCLYLTNGAVLAGFTLTNGATQAVGDDSRQRSGGGIWCEFGSTIVSNCVLAGNSAYSFGGGARFGTLTNCTLTGNSAQNGGGATEATLNNCNLTGNWADYGGGTFSSMLSDCALTANSAQYGGAAYSGTFTNCMLSNNSAQYSGGGAYFGTLNGCTLTSNSAQSGGGAAFATLNKSTLSENSAEYGGGATEATLNKSALTGNSALSDGGGAYSGTLTNCTLSGNSAQNGGGAANATLNNCALTGNSAACGGGASGGTLNNCRLSQNSASDGGGACGGALNKCTLTGNSASTGGGGVSGGTIDNCTLTGNWAYSGGGAEVATLNNCIVYYNRAPFGANYDQSTLNYCCTTPLPATGIGNLTAEPQLASVSHLSAGSPCREAGSADYATDTDVDGEPWANPPSMGCDEYWSGSVTGALSAEIVIAYTNVAVGFAVDLQAVIAGRVSESRWDFGDGVVVSNRPYASHAWGAAGDYVVELRAYNDSYPGGVAATVTVHVMAQPVHYVALSSPAPAPPYSSWATAATNIQDAVDAATVPGALVWVTNGVYEAGAREVYGMSNRVAVTKPLTLQSVNGAAVTSIVGYQVPGTTNGAAAVRCVYLTNAAVLAGFTLTNGATQSEGDYSTQQSGGGVWCESASSQVSNCVLAGNSASADGGGAYNGTLTNCTLTGNSASSDGGGAYGGTLNNCTLTGNSAPAGGGAEEATLNNCTLRGNGAWGVGGGAYSGTLNNCTLTGNWADQGGGAFSGTLNNCSLTGNSASYGGGADSGTLNNCTLTGNSANDLGGGACDSALHNCIVYYNSARSGGNYYGGTLNYCCTTPLPAGGTNNLMDEPQLASASHLSANSPCRSAGSAAYASGLDIDGEAWANPPAIGCDEYWSGSVTGALSAAIVVSYTNAVLGFAVDFQALIEGRVSASRWDFGDGVVVSNQPWVSHVWGAEGEYGVELRAYNKSYPGGVAAYVTVQVVSQPVHYVALSNPAPAWPYTTWATAATNIQDGVDAVSAGGALVLVSNGVYQVGARAVSGVSNRVVVTKAVRVQSVNGPAVTSIVGYQVPGTTNGAEAVRCVYLTKGAMLAGFTLTNGATQTGGGVWCDPLSGVVSNCVLRGNYASFGGGAYSGTLNNCTLSGNSAASLGGGAYYGMLNNCTLTANSASCGGGAYSGTLNNCTLTSNSANSGGGAYEATLNNCTLTRNSAKSFGGGASDGTLNNCTLTGNSASYGGGAYFGTLNNCIVYYAGTDNYYGGTLNYCCTVPMPDSGTGNFTNAPLFVDQPGGDLHLQTNSPCINAGLNAFAVGATDLDGKPRISGGTVDMGAYEFQFLDPFHAWLQSYGLPTDGSADYLDADHDGMNNWQEWLCGTVPTNALSVLRMVEARPAGTNVTVTWQSVAGMTYWLERCTGLAGHPAFSLLAINLLGQAGTTSYTDTNAVGRVQSFYRVGVGNYVAPTNPPRPVITWQGNPGAGTVALSWSGEGYRLQAQTNGLGGGLTNWFDYPGGTTSPVTVPLDAKNRSVFYRLVWP